MNVTNFVLQRLSRGSSSFVGLLNELPPALPNRHYRLTRALRSLRRRGRVKKCYPGGAERPQPHMLLRDRVWTLGRESTGCPCGATCCDNPNQVRLDQRLHDEGHCVADLPAEFQWWWSCRNCGRSCNCEV